ncbi:MAG: family 2 glycosyl transferase [Bacteroidetes bacterium 4572_77]|nr:MAG: family 2 glycosyl transferase [Bacteroidetes bacterium 4572_77]
MLQNITKSQKQGRTNLHFSILIPSWNNLAYLKLCVNSIRKNSQLNHQIIIILNQANDGSLEWVKTQEDLDYVWAKENIGICYGLNSTRSLIQADYVLYANDDMYMLPKWDEYLWQEIKQIGHQEFMLSATMIEPFDTGNTSVIVQHYGDGLENFEEEKLLKEFEELQKSDWTGSTWPPNVMHRDLWDLVGGMSVEFHPGMYSDPDLSKKLWDAGVRYFKGVGKSRVYHFGSKSTKRIKRNIGSQTFLGKWKITSRSFTKNHLQRGSDFKILPKDYKPSFWENTIHLFKRLKNATK